MPVIRQGKAYWEWVKQQKAALQGDGCTSSPDLFYTRCCDEHDIYYRTGKDEDGKPITRAQADKRLFQCMSKTGKTPFVVRFLLPVFYSSAVRLFGGKAWKGS